MLIFTNNPSHNSSIKSVYTVFLSLIFLILFNTSAFAEEINALNKTTIRFGILPDSAQHIIDDRYKPLITFIEQELDIKIDVVKSQNYQQLLTQFKEKKIDLAFFGGYTFINAQINSKAEPLVMRDIDLQFSTVFLVNADNKNSKLEDFKGKAFSFGSKQSTSGHLMPRYFLSERDINPESFFTKVRYSGSHDNTAYLVRDNKVDLGAANSDVIRDMFKKGTLKQSDIRILWETPAYSDYVWAIQPNFEPLLRQRLLDTFLSLSPLNPSHKYILNALGAHGFLPANNEDFDSLRKVVKLLEHKMK